MSEYAETAALIAVMNEDEAGALALLRSFLPHELRLLDDQLSELRGLITHVQRNPHAPGAAS